MIISWASLIGEALDNQISVWVSGAIQPGVFELSQQLPFYKTSYLLKNENLLFPLSENFRGQMALICGQCCFIIKTKV